MLVYLAFWIKKFAQDGLEPTPLVSNALSLSYIGHVQTMLGSRKGKNRQDAFQTISDFNFRLTRCRALSTVLGVRFSCRAISWYEHPAR